ncbi:unnamed protein product [Peronospora effusa]|uniref:Uncharacterized protein n=1 Tax=Peronospora effusa TaxID=542832 RepID=A0A3M6VQZ5_9STRA|nr:hypothetical protein DD238_002606 [Peronospora effusa]RQM16664.1 hypothetical protein DD237_003763 [Peronospora effusa]CAI5721793.1 unnamed protein product [Peronospora effusa]
MTSSHLQKRPCLNMFSAAQIVPNVPLLEPSLPVFSMREAQFRKAHDANTLMFNIPTRSSLLLPLLRPVCRTYRQQDTQCLHLLQTAALVPSCNCNKLLTIVTQALKMAIFPQTKSRLEKKLRPLITKLQKQSDKDLESGTRPLLALQLKETVAELLRCWIADPVEGFVLRKEHVVNGMRLDDLVTTPAGAGHLRGYRREDGFCTVLYPWGHGFVHVKDVKKVDQALGKHLKKRTYNEYVAFEHQQLYKQIEELLANLPSPTTEERDLVKKEASVTAENEKYEDMKKYTELLYSLEDEHVDTTVLRKDSGLLHRVQALVDKAKELRRSHIPRPEQKVLRMDKDHELSPPAGQGGFDTSMQSPVHIAEQEEHDQELAEKEKGTAVNETEIEAEKK